MRVFKSSRRTVAVRLHLATAAALISLILVSALVYASGSNRIEAARISTPRAVAEGAATIAAGYEAQVRSGAMPEPAGKAASLAAIRAVRYGEADYVWVNDLAPRMIMHPIKPELDGKDLTAMAHPNGLHLIVVFADRVPVMGRAWCHISGPGRDRTSRS